MWSAYAPETIEPNLQSHEMTQMAMKEEAYMTGLSGLSLKYLFQSSLNSGPISLSSSSVGRICAKLRIVIKVHEKHNTNLEACVDRIRRESGLLGADLPLVEEFATRLRVTTEEVIKGGSLFANTVDLSSNPSAQCLSTGLMTPTR